MNSSNPSTRLVILRHGQAQPFHPGGDYARQLTPRGELDCAAAGQHLASLPLTPTKILCSSAMRTRMSADSFRQGFQQGGQAPLPDPVLLDDIYEAELETLWHILQYHSTGQQCLVLIGHNPGLSMLTDLLTHTDLAAKNLFASLAPGSMAIVDCGPDWQDLAPDQGSILDLRHP